MSERPVPLTAAQRLTAGALVGLFLALTLSGLDRWPPLHGDEAWIASPGYKLFNEGVFGSDMMGPAWGMDRHYFEFMPLMSVLQGAVLHVLGLEVGTLRLVPVAAGVLTLLATFAVARRAGGPGAGLIAMGLMLLWKWTAGGAGYAAGTGIPLLDLSRVARYDVLVPPLGLGALLLAGPGRRSPAADVGAGILAGLAGLAHLYGLGWLVVVLLLAWVNEHDGRARAVRVAAGAVLPWIPWLLFVAAHRAAFNAQMAVNADRFALLSPSFYAANLAAEIHRYRLGLRDGGWIGRWGVWLLLAGVPAALGWLVQRTRSGDAWARAIAVPALVLPVGFALLLAPKLFHYALTLVPVFAVALAWPLARLAGAGSWRRLLAVAALAPVAVEGAIAIAAARRLAAAAPPAAEVLSGVRGRVPPAARVLGPAELWLAFPAGHFTALSSARLTALETPGPRTVRPALERLRPDVVILRWPYFRGDPEAAAFLAAQAAPPDAAVGDQHGQPILIYAMKPARAR